MAGRSVDCAVVADTKVPVVSSRARAVLGATLPWFVIFWLVPAIWYAITGLDRAQLTYLAIVALGIVVLMQLVFWSMTTSRPGPHGLTPAEGYDVYRTVGRGEGVDDPLHAARAVEIATSRVRIARNLRIVGPVLVIAFGVGLATRRAPGDLVFLLVSIRITAKAWIEYPRLQRALELNRALVPWGSLIGVDATTGTVPPTLG